MCYQVATSNIKTSIIHPINTLAFPFSTSLLSYPQRAQTTPQNVH